MVGCVNSIGVFITGVAFLLCGVKLATSEDSHKFFNVLGYSYIAIGIITTIWSMVARLA